MKKIFVLIACFSLIFNSLQAQVRIKSANQTKVKASKSKYPPEWAYTSNIYEVNLRQYTPEGTINAFKKHLPRLQGMGVEILWFMPIQPIGVKARKGPLGSYYSIKDYMAVNPEMGSMEDWIEMVDEAHRLGMKVLLDWVANHTAFDHYWAKDHPEFYNKDEKGNIISPVEDWSDVADLNYDNKELREAMIRNMKFWVDASGIDGFRCDMAHMVPTDFWQSARRELEIAKPGLFMLGETEDPGLYKEAFDMTYGWKLHHTMVDIAKGEKNANDIRKYLKELDSWPPNGFIMYFTDNHDENSWQKSAYDRFGESLEAFDVLTFGLKGMPLIYSGQEAANKKVLRFFDKDTIDFSSFPMQDFYSKLLKLKKTQPALMHGERGGEYIDIPNGADENVLSFVRKKGDSKILFVLNLSSKSQKIKLKSAELAGFTSDYFDSKAEPLTLKESYSLKLKPWEYKVYVYKK